MKSSDKMNVFVHDLQIQLKYSVQYNPNVEMDSPCTEEAIQNKDVRQTEGMLICDG